MNDFDSVIAQLMNSGKSFQEITDMMTESINRADKQQKAVSAFDKRIDDMYDAFTDTVDTGLLDKNLAAMAMTLVAEKEKDCPMKTAEDVDDYYKFAMHTLDTLPALYELNRSFTDMFVPLKNKSKEKGKHVETSVKKKDAPKPKETNDWDEVQKFLAEIMGGV